ncbi:MAG TPA: patatin-like phospholipase family protein [Burkholderiales bacterium]|nr:patatin-like phospholipase family protein [Burkholderiales bacterium]
MQHTLRHSRLAEHLAGLFDAADPAVLAEIEANAQWLSLGGGETLFRRGEPGDAAYIVISGRLRIVDGARALNEVGAGETLGEMALLSGEPRSATVFAVRDSLLARLPADAFNRLVHRHPSVLRRITGHLVERLRHINAAPARAQSGVRTIAVVPADARTAITAFARRLVDALAVHGATLHLDAERVNRELGRDGAAGCEGSDAGSVGLVGWLNEQELRHRFVVYEAGEPASRWTERAMRQADHVLFVADSGGQGGERAVERYLADRTPGAQTPRASLVLVRSTHATPPESTSAMLDGCRVDAHYHVAMDSQADFARLARCLAGAAIGLVLGGGGARGFAHLGVLRALAESGVPVDWVGGTSIGGIIAALVAQGVPPEETLARCRRHFQALRDPTLPLVALLAGRRIRARLEDAFGAVAIEDLPLPYFCVSTNLTRAAQALHERGPLARAIRASISLPGILPPMRLDADLHVDGGLVNNLPIDVMAAKPEVGAVIAVDVGAELEMGAPAGFEPELSGWRVLWERFAPRPGRDRPPTIMSVLTRSSFVASVYWARERHTAEQASLYLRVPVADLRLLAFERIDDIAARGYDATREAIKVWWEARR